MSCSDGRIVWGSIDVHRDNLRFTNNLIVAWPFLGKGIIVPMSTAYLDPSEFSNSKSGETEEGKDVFLDPDDIRESVRFSFLRDDGNFKKDVLQATLKFDVKQGRYTGVTMSSSSAGQAWKWLCHEYESQYTSLKEISRPSEWNGEPSFAQRY
jgi:hypothetical protein